MAFKNTPIFAQYVRPKRRFEALAVFLLYPAVERASTHGPILLNVSLPRGIAVIQPGNNFPVCFDYLPGALQSAQISVRCSFLDISECPKSKGGYRRRCASSPFPPGRTTEATSAVPSPVSRCRLSLNPRKPAGARGFLCRRLAVEILRTFPPVHSLHALAK